MFYEELYAQLGKLFYHIAAADGKVSQAEKKSLQDLIQNTWKPLENSTDKYGTDHANLIAFSFDYEDAEGTEEEGYESFEKFYLANKSQFTPEIIINILRSAEAIASSYKASNENEKKVLNKISSLFDL